MPVLCYMDTGYRKCPVELAFELHGYLPVTRHRNGLPAFPDLQDELIYLATLSYCRVVYSVFPHTNFRPIALQGLLNIFHLSFHFLTRVSSMG